MLCSFLKKQINKSNQRSLKHKSNNILIYVSFFSLILIINYHQSLAASIRTEGAIKSQDLVCCRSYTDIQWPTKATSTVLKLSSMCALFRSIFCTCKTALLQYFIAVHSNHTELLTLNSLLSTSNQSNQLWIKV